MLQSGYILLILAAIVTALGGMLVFAVLRLAVAAREANRRLREGGAEAGVLTAALQDAVRKLRDQERATHARAEASERLSGEIIASLTSGLLVVGVDGEVRIEGEFANVEGDDILLRQALSNLCRNALEACSEAGIVPLIVLHGIVDHDQKAAHLSISDNGPGIDPASRDRIFWPFFTTKADGTGLGLALTQKIIVTHNGWVTAGTAAEGGARLEGVLPLSPTP